MTADWFTFDSGVLKKVSTRITNEVSGVSRVLYDSEFLFSLPLYLFSILFHALPLKPFLRNG